MFIPDRTRPLIESVSIGSTVVFGRTLASTGNAVQLTSSDKDLKNGVIVQALSTNADSVYIGDSGVTTSNGFELQAGQATSIAVDNINKLYLAGTTGDGVCWLGAN